jgi:hypothetical protein
LSFEDFFVDRKVEIKRRPFMRPSELSSKPVDAKVERVL